MMANKMELTDCKDVPHIDISKASYDKAIGALIYIQEFSPFSEIRMLTSALKTKPVEEWQKPVAFLVILESVISLHATRTSFEYFKLQSKSRPLNPLTGYPPERIAYEHNRILSLFILIIERTKESLMYSLSLLKETKLQERRVNEIRYKDQPRALKNGYELSANIVKDKKFKLTRFVDLLYRSPKDGLQEGWKQFVQGVLLAPKPINLLKRIQSKLNQKAKSARVSDMKPEESTQDPCETCIPIKFSEAKAKVMGLMRILDQHYYSNLRVIVASLKTEAVSDRPVQLIACEIKKYSVVIKPCVLIQGHDRYSYLTMKERMQMRRKSMIPSCTNSFARPKSICSVADPYLAFLNYSNSLPVPEGIQNRTAKAKTKVLDEFSIEECNSPLIRSAQLSAGEVEEEHPILDNSRKRIENTAIRKVITFKTGFIRQLKAKKKNKVALKRLFGALNSFQLRKLLYTWSFNTRKECINQENEYSKIIIPQTSG